MYNNDVNSELCVSNGKWVSLVRKFYYIKENIYMYIYVYFFF